MYSRLPSWSNKMMHVKWFTDDKDWNPMPIAYVITPAFLFWLAFTSVLLLLLAYYNESIRNIRVVNRMQLYLDPCKRFNPLILRVGLGIGLSLQLSTGTYLAPDLVSNERWIYIVLIIAIIGLLHRKTLIISAIALTILYTHTLIFNGVFHALDYMFYIGIIYYLFVIHSKWSRTASAALYIWTGLSLAWLAIEKMTLAKLACSLMHEYGLPSLGFTVEDFVLISAFIEIGLAWAFMVGMMNRFAAFMLTSIFLVTTTVFGFKEIVGHMVVHTLLIMFIIEGTDNTKMMFQFHRSLMLRCTFVVVNFWFLLFTLMLLYVWMGSPGNILSSPMSS
ncbi:hypothetical protein [Paenibacillus sp. 481]|uniref:hypothetical protein n=1 Tax=Paenibacillus sp. 481 TaxID=2835869 RepID=UPI001E42C4E1|nr:hypothetical protein [Paenibacillus sp. 481]UHA73150.1 hypothetical protein KIK04_21555 [Paenibacillus sp. 481]